MFRKKQRERSADGVQKANELSIDVEILIKGSGGQGQYKIEMQVIGPDCWTRLPEALKSAGKNLLEQRSRVIRLDRM